MMVETQMDERAHVHPNGSFIIYREQLEVGLRFPFTSTICVYYDNWGIKLGQIMPNRVR